jgi:GntR family transcriptional regulator / MocR family aminotransferase
MKRSAPKHEDLFVPLDLSRPLQDQIYERIRAAIVRGELTSGSQLPSTRALARGLRLSRTTTQLAYDQLQAEGYLSARPGSGTFIAAIAKEDRPAPRGVAAKTQCRLPTSRYAARVRRSRRRWAALTEPVPRQAIHFHPGVPDARLFPRMHWARLVSECARQTSGWSSAYPDVIGTPALRNVLAQRLTTTRGVRCSAEQIVIITGIHQGLGLVARAVADPGAVAVVEDPCYIGAAGVLDAEGLRIEHASVDDEGIDLRRVRASAARRARLVYVTPSHQFPTGAVMSYPRRRALLSWARTHGAVIFEEDYHAEFRFIGRPIEALHALDDAGLVVHAGTFAKSMSPALRVAYMVLPPALIEPIFHAKWLADFGSPALEQVALARFIERGDYARHVRRCRVTYFRRRQALMDALRQHLPAATCSGQDAGLHVLVHLPDVPQRATPSLLAEAAAQGVGVMSAHVFHVSPPRHAQLLLGYACLTESEIAEDIRRLALAVRVLGRK